ncbi:hypothetical protein [Latilactobacillus sakei]|uniref:hypothetical protein n=1 Tax=Latilactobacillus sakei TaxID=1599 RepID=UPI000DCAE270|nr:hypothetical protein [Latilactobacillus sakei]AWZ44726.1 hypothetical protein CXB68_06575 [Latilactobacillus sakei]
MKKKLLIVPLISLIVLAFYLSPFFGISSDNSNILVVFITYVCVFIGFFRNEIYFKRYEVFLIIIQLAVAVIAAKANLISLTIIVLLNVFFNCYSIESTDGLAYYIDFSLLLFFLVLIGYFLFGFNQSYDVSMWRIDMIVNRRSIGFTQPNQAMFAWFGIFSASILDTKRKTQYAILLASSIFIYYQTKSRTGLVIILLILILIFLFRRRLDNEVPSFLKLLIISFPLLLLLVSVLMMSQSENQFINSLLTGRPVLYKRYFDLTGITMWGNKLIENTMLDNSYLSMLLGKGVVFTGLYILTLMYLVISAKKMSFRAYIVLMMFFIYGLTETIIFRFELLLPIIISLNLTSNQDYEKASVSNDS